jgi:putative ABC transport system substrate-binding protein
MKRREFIKIASGAAALWPFTASAQRAGKLPTVGFLGTVAQSAWPVDAFEERLRELGWIADRTITIEHRWAEGSTERIVEFAAEFVRLKVDVIVTGGNAISAAKRATSTIPIIFAVAVDPVGSGFVANLSRPGGNVTGLSLQGPDLAGKRAELLREMLPSLRRLGIMANVGYPAAKQELTKVQAAAHALGLEAFVLEIERAEDIAPSFEGLNRRADALYVVADALTDSNLARISNFALSARLPTIFGTRSGVQAGGLMSYGPSLPALFRRTADYVDKILKGAKPAEIPVEQPTKFDLAVNLKTARTLGLELSPTLLARADEVIE